MNVKILLQLYQKWIFGDPDQPGVTIEKEVNETNTECIYHNDLDSSFQAVNEEQCIIHRSM